MKNIKGIAYALISSSTFGLIPLFSIPVLASGAMGVPSLLFTASLFRYGCDSCRGGTTPEAQFQK